MVKNKDPEINPLRDVEEDKRFWVSNGIALNNLYELEGALQNIDEATFKHHVNEEKNDFYNWVRDVIQDQKLANMLIREKSRDKIADFVRERIKELIVEQKAKLSHEQELVVREKKAKRNKDYRKNTDATYAAEEIMHEQSVERIEEKQKSRIGNLINDKHLEKPGALIALIALAAIIITIGIPHSTITGATIVETSASSGFSLTAFVIFIAAIAAVIFVKHKKNK